jgi:LAS superfamily LD-carboxypeptidase LdcB
MAVDDDVVFDDGKSEPTSGQGAVPPLTTTSVAVGNDGSLKTITVSIDKTPSEELRKTADFVLAKVNIDTNAAKSPPKVSDQTPAPLPENTVTGITKGVLTEFTSVTVDGFTMDKVVGYDWLYMKAAAAKDGVFLKINSSFRTPAEQQKLIDARMNPDGTLTEAGKRKGRAGPINGNNAGGHLMGQALDINTGMSVADLRAALIRGTSEEDAIRESYVTGSKKPAVAYSAAKLEEKVVADLLRLAMQDYTRLNPASLSPQYIWLVQNSANFGFQRSVSTEPWHHAHFSRSIVTKNIDIQKTDTLLASASSNASSAAVLRTDKPEATLAMDRVVHDTSKSYERSAKMARTTRAELFVEKARQAVYQGAGLASLASRYETKLAAAAIPPPTYKPGVLTAVSFDYATGLWGDGSKV